MSHINIPIFIPELACPFQCVFCNQQKISGHEKLPDEKEIREIIQSHLATISIDTEVEVAFFGGSFTALSLSEQERLLSIPQEFIQSGEVSGIRLSTRPDYISKEILDLLKRMGVTAIELGAQSLVDEVLQKSGRGHRAKEVELASKMILEAHFELGLQMMLGLPGDSAANAILTAKKIVELGANTTRIYPTLVISDTALEELYRKGKYCPLTIDEAVNQTKEIVKIFETNKVKILRIGLHPSEGLINGDDFVEGPFHPNFSEMVQSKICMNLIMDQINEVPENRQTKQLQIYVHPKKFNFAIGYKAKNKKKLLSLFHSVKFMVEKDMKNKCRIEFI